MFLIHKNQVLLKVLLHFSTWLLLLVFPVFLSMGDGASVNYNRIIKFTLVPMFFYVIIFYSNYLSLIDCFLFKKKFLFFTLINISMILLFTWLHVEIKDLLNMVSEVKPLPGGSAPPKTGLPVQLFIYKDIISMIIPVIISFALRSNEKWAKTEAEKKDREKDILDSELQHLRYQLQPHFFFNSLNTIYALIERSPSSAQETVHSLARLMRYLLYETDKEKVNLCDEIDFMKQYIELMKLRLSDKTKVNASFPAIAENYRITPLLFISLIENAFKHGISATQQSELFFSLSVSENTVRFFAENTSFPKTENDKSGSGIGLINLKKRLELSYPGSYSFHTKTEGGSYSVLLEINGVKPQNS